MDRQRARKMLIEDVLPALKEKWPDGDKDMHIRIKQDNVSPCVDNEDAEVKACCKENGWNISMCRRPAKSPDLNVLDLVFLQHSESAGSNSATDHRRPSRRGKASIRYSRCAYSGQNIPATAGCDASDHVGIRVEPVPARAHLQSCIC
ncbi:TPA: hypothetical protein N0F65_006346 [Lagenidium giganteum]|uniref:Uncharacterized protein n=1 Tax=Lagenidium giganteum TaxID=4803 RepID=A0AAV2YIK4_9STRA|nr:TPA: hypothetical protein N0F65_006346 [Lagenidium giganteum]